MQTTRLHPEPIRAVLAELGFNVAALGDRFIGAHDNSPEITALVEATCDGRWAAQLIWGPPLEPKAMGKSLLTAGDVRTFLLRAMEMARPQDPWQMPATQRAELPRQVASGLKWSALMYAAGWVMAVLFLALR